MNRKSPLLFAAVALIALAVSLSVNIQAQVGKSIGLLDANSASEKDLLALPHMTPAIVKGIIDKRPFMSILDLNAFSPGVQIQIDNLSILERDDVEWMDSCSSGDCEMINSLWAERREIVRVTVPLAGPRRRAIFHLCRTAERASDGLRRTRGAGRTAFDNAGRQG